ncbi:MAG: hypothetical protein HYZ75_05760, partial [Elusimicrobia bacterium]|nr:hypothetical protein [Elusimicrobiota bacterium]
KQALAHEVEDALVDAELDKKIRNGDKVTVDWDEAAGALTAKPEPKITDMGGWALGMMAPLALAALPMGVLMSVGVAGIAAVFAYTAWRVASSYSGPHGRAQAPPTARSWVFRTAALMTVMLAADWALKALFWGSGLYVYHYIVPTRVILMAAAIPLSLAFAAWMMTLAHAGKPPLDGLRRFRDSHPVIGGLVWSVLQVLTFPVGVDDARHAGDLAAKSPAVSKALGVFAVGAAAVLAATLGNGLEALLNHKVIDFIPVGPGRANLADFLLFFGLPFVWMTLDFFGAVRKAVAARKPAVMNFAKFYALPVLGFLAFVLASSTGLSGAPLPFIYGAFFATLFGTGTLAATSYIQRRLAEFNGSLQDGTFNPMPSAPAFSAGYRARRWLAGALASAAALLPLVGAVNHPSLGAGDYTALVERYRGRLPKVIITDYDDTFMDNSDGKGLVISEARLKLLEDLKAAGVRVTFATNRPLDGGDFAMSALLLERMSPELKADFIISTGGGAEVYKLSPQGELPAAPAFSGPTVTDAERGAITRLISAEAARQGIAPDQARHGEKPYEHSWMLGMGLDAAKKAALSTAEWDALAAARNAKLTAVFKAASAGLKAQGLEFGATLKFPARDDLEPYIRFSKSTKAFAVKAILELIEAEGARVDAEDVLMLGDDFTVPGYDSAMPKGLPGGTAVAFGLAADARIPNVHQLGGGPDALERFLRDMIRP